MNNRGTYLYHKGVPFNILVIVQRKICLMPICTQEMGLKRAPVTKRVRALFLSTKQTNFPAASVAGDSPGCRSPPSDFDFAYQLKKSKSEELHMKEDQNIFRRKHDHKGITFNILVIVQRKICLMPVCTQEMGCLA